MSEWAAGLEGRIARADRAGGAGWSVRSYREFISAVPLFARSVVALGTFDGVHVGHQRILKEACSLAEELGTTPVALTFDRHPHETLAPSRAPKLLSSFEGRIRKILEAGIAHAVAIRFDPECASVEAEDFLESALLGAMGAAGIVVGYNFRFGRGARGDTAFLAEASKAFGFALKVVPPVTREGEPVSSTRIRTRLEAGDVEQAATLLGRPFSLPGRIVAGDARGRTLGYPTANLDPDPKIAIPGDGVYLTEIAVSASGGVYNGLTVIGSRPSFGTLSRAIESFLLDFEGDLYGAEVEIRFLKRLRDVVRFESKDALVEQIANDVAAARAFFAERLRR